MDHISGIDDPWRRFQALNCDMLLLEETPTGKGVSGPIR